jgi:hypothetical protein
MALFSQRMGIRPMQKAIQRESMDEELRNSLWNDITACRHEIDIFPIFRYGTFGRRAEGGFGYDGRAEQARYFGPSVGFD